MRLFYSLLIALFFPSAASAITLTRVSGPNIYVDAGKNLHCNYVGFAIYNNGASDLNDAWAGIGSFTGGNLSLAPYETGTYHIGPIPVGVTRTAFFYLQGTAINAPQGATVSVYSAKPPSSVTASQVFSWAQVESVGQNASNKVSVVASGPNPPALGGEVNMAVNGDTGQLGSQNIMVFSPSTFTDWNAGVFQLYATDIVWGGGARSASNVLAITGTTGADEGAYTITYRFRALGSTSAPSTVSPIGFFAQGSGMGHTDTGNYGIGANFLPTTALSNYITLSKTADATTVVYPEPVHFRIKVSNTGPLTATLDQIIDQLPSSPGLPTVVAGSSTWDGIPIPDPLVNGSQLNWSGQFTVLGDSTYELAFDLVLAPVAGSYANSAWGFIGSILLDRTIDSSDNSPTAFSVNGLLATPTITPTFSATPSFTLTSTRSPTPSHTPSVTPTFTDVPPGSTATDTPTASPTFTETGTASASPSPTPSGTQTATPSPSPTITLSRTVSPTRTRTPTRTFSPTPTNSPAGTSTITPTFSRTHSVTRTSTLTATPTRTSTVSATVTVTPSVTLTATESTTFSPSPSFSASPTETVTYSITVTHTNSPTVTPTSTGTATPTLTLTATDTPTATATRTATNSFTASPTRTITFTVTPTFSHSPTVTATPTITNTNTPVAVPVLAKPWPNPFRPLKGQRLRLDLGVALAGTVKVKAYNMAGELVRNVYEAQAANGTLSIFWDGKNNQGETVASGTYLMLAETPSGPVRALVAVLK